MPTSNKRPFTAAEKRDRGEETFKSLIGDLEKKINAINQEFGIDFFMYASKTYTSDIEGDERRAVQSSAVTDYNASITPEGALEALQFTTALDEQSVVFKKELFGSFVGKSFRNANTRS